MVVCNGSSLPLFTPFWFSSALPWVTQDLSPLPRREGCLGKSWQLWGVPASGRGGGPEGMSDKAQVTLLL